MNINKKSLDVLGIVIDNACDNSDEKELVKIIVTQEQYVEILSDSNIKVTLYYYLANCWSGLRKIRHQDEDNIWKYNQEELFKEIYYLRKAIKTDSFDSLELDLRLSIYTNLAIAFSHYGRPINALKYFNKALFLYPKFFMALLNKAICLERYAKLTYDDGHKRLLLRDAYFNYIKAFDEINIHLENSTFDIEYYTNAKSNIEQSITSLKKYLDEKVDLNEHKLSQYKNEIKYRKWILNNTLFLNPMNDLGSISIASHDPLNLPSLTIKIDMGFPKYITYFNQIKQEFIMNRCLLYEGLTHLTNKYYDKETSIIEDYDYNLYDINIEKIKTSFKGFYSSFDKIAYFLNEYFELGIDENHINFRKVWIKDKELNQKFNQFENLALRGLYLISKDIFYSKSIDPDYIKVIEPEAEAINTIRNHLEHKFIMIKLLDIENDLEKRERSFSITEDELQERTIHLAQLARESIIYLSSAVYHEELKKKKEFCVEMHCEVKK